MKQIILAVVLSLVSVGAFANGGQWYIMGNDYVNIISQPNTDNKALGMVSESLTQRLFDSKADCDDALAEHRVSKVKIYKTDSTGTFNQSPTTLKAERIANANCQQLD